MEDDLNRLNSLSITTEAVPVKQQEQESQILEDLKGAVGPVLDQIEKEVDSDHAAIVIAAKEIKDKKGEYAGIQTFVDICGDYGIVGEALFNELVSQIGEGKPGLFNLFCEIIEAVKEECEITDDNPIPEGNYTLH